MTARCSASGGEATRLAARADRRAPKATTTTRTSTSPTTEVPLPERPACRRGGRNPAHRAGGIPHARLPRLGPRRPDDPRRRSQPFLLEMNTSPGHDRPYSGADGGARGRHQLRGSCRLHLLRAPHWTRPCRLLRRCSGSPDAPWLAAARCHARPMPLTSACMNFDRSACSSSLVRCSHVLAIMMLWAGAPADLRGQRDQRRRRCGAQQRADDPRQRGAAARRQLLHDRPGRWRGGLRSGAVGPPGDRPPRLAGPARGAARRASAGRAVGDARRGDDKLVNSFGEVFEAKSATSRTTAAACSGPEGSWRTWAMLTRRSRARAAGRAHRRAGAVGARRVAGRAGHRRAGRARPRQRRRSDGARGASSRSVPQVPDALSARR